jgi:pyruvate,orthophosphate dikinase
MEDGMSDAKYVYAFGAGKADGKAEMKNLLGGKGANLAEMCRLGLPVPPGFTISTEVCNWFFEPARKLPPDAGARGGAALARVEQPRGPQVRRRAESAAGLRALGRRVSMPGMMDTVLNLGLNDETVVGLAAQSGNERFAWDSYRRFVQMYGDVVLGSSPDEVEQDPFEAILDAQEARAQGSVRHRPDRGGPPEARGRLQAPRAGAHGPSVPRGPPGAAVGRRFARCSAPGPTTAPSAYRP